VLPSSGEKGGKRAEALSVRISGLAKLKSWTRSIRGPNRYILCLFPNFSPEDGSKIHLTKRCNFII
jgi:hypothetical protein